MALSFCSFYSARFVLHSCLIPLQTNRIEREMKEGREWGMKRIVNLSLLFLLPLCFYKWKKVECVKNTKEKNKSTNSTPSFPFLLVQFNYNEVREEKEAWIKLNKKRKKGNEVVSFSFVLLLLFPFHSCFSLQWKGKEVKRTMGKRSPHKIECCVGFFVLVHSV